MAGDVYEVELSRLPFTNWLREAVARTGDWLEGDHKRRLRFIVPDFAQPFYGERHLESRRTLIAHLYAGSISRQAKPLGWAAVAEGNAVRFFLTRPFSGEPPPAPQGPEETTTAE